MHLNVGLVWLLLRNLHDQVLGWHTYMQYFVPLANVWSLVLRSLTQFTVRWCCPTCSCPTWRVQCRLFSKLRIRFSRLGSQTLHLNNLFDLAQCLGPLDHHLVVLEDLCSVEILLHHITIKMMTWIMVSVIAVFCCNWKLEEESLIAYHREPLPKSYLAPE